MCIASNFQDAFLSTLSLRRATCRLLDTRIHTTISIHALLAESDKRPGCQQQGKKYFYPRSPCGERLLNPFKTLIILIFLSTLSLRRATTAEWPACTAAGNFYPRSPCGERHSALVKLLLISSISIHALLAESDRTKAHYAVVHVISIHALLAESDAEIVSRSSMSCQFLSTLSLRRATMVVGCNHVANLFLSTLSLRRATNNVLPAYAACGISIHALLAESDAKNTRDYATLRNFYPRSPCGERQFAHYGNPRRLVISIHALLAESDAWSGETNRRLHRFLSTLSLRRATSATTSAKTQ